MESRLVRRHVDGVVTNLFHQTLQIPLSQCVLYQPIVFMDASQVGFPFRFPILGSGSAGGSYRESNQQTYDAVDLHNPKFRIKRSTPQLRVTIVAGAHKKLWVVSGSGISWAVLLDLV